MDTRRSFLKHTTQAAGLGLAACQGLSLTACGDASSGEGSTPLEVRPTSDEYVDLVGRWLDARPNESAAASQRVQVDQVNIWSEAGDSPTTATKLEQFTVEFSVAPGGQAKDGLYELIDDQGARRTLFLQAAGERDGVALLRADFALLVEDA